MKLTGRPRGIQMDMGDVRRMTEEGHRLSVIAAKYGCSKQTVLNRMKEAGIPAHPKHSNPGHLNPSWKGGRYYDDDGYVLVHAPEHPHATKQGRVREHRLVMERVLGRYLLPTEVVDHIDGQKDNNDPSNLRVFARNGDHLAETLRGRVPAWSEDGKRRIRAAVSRPRSRRTAAIQSVSEVDGLK